MKQFEDRFSSKDNLGLYMQGWEPDEGFHTVVCLVHGLGEHSGRYMHMAERLNRAGYAMIGFDLRGHGKSEGQRGFSPTLDSLVEDIDIFIHQVSERYPKKPRFLYGHSLGGLLALDYLIRFKPELSGAIISAPGLRTSLQDQTAKVLLAKLLGFILPKFSLSSGLDPSTLSRDAAVVKAYVEDPMVHDDMTFGLARSMLNGITLVNERASEIETPMLVMHGSDDRLVFPQGSKDLCKLVKGDCTLKMWDGLFHEIHNEAQKDEVFDVMVHWMDDRRK